MRRSKQKSYTHNVFTLEQINAWAGNPAAFVKTAEDEEWGFVRSICEGIIADDIRIVMIAGPSSSGKTTSAYQVAQTLREMGRPSEVISLDDFYMSKDRMPVLPDGTKDFESVHALDTRGIRACLVRLLETGRCETPVFDFAREEPSSQKRHISLPGGTLVVEGLHGANPLITEGFEESMRKVYVSVNTAVTENGEILIPHREVRLIRRMVRDARSRNTEPEITMEMWSNILRGEKEYIDPFVETCDVKLDTFMEYELNLMASCGLPVVSRVTEHPVYGEEAQRLVSALRKFTPISETWVPKNSMIREFIG